MSVFHRLLTVIVFAVWAGSTHAELISLQITKREPFAAGQVFGDVGPYEQITALARFAVDPKECAIAASSIWSWPR